MCTNQLGLGDHSFVQKAMYNAMMLVALTNEDSFFLRQLLQCKTNAPDPRSNIDEECHSPLVFALCRDKQISAATIIECDPESVRRPSTTGDSPLVTVAKLNDKKNIWAVKLLIQKGANPNDVINSSSTVFGAALRWVYCGWAKMDLLSLFVDCGYELTRHELADICAVHFAENQINNNPTVFYDIAQSLLRMKADPDSASKGNPTPLTYAFDERDGNLFEMLLGNKADPTKPLSSSDPQQIIDQFRASHAIDLPPAILKNIQADMCPLVKAAFMVEAKAFSAMLKQNFERSEVLYSLLMSNLCQGYNYHKKKSDAEFGTPKKEKKQHLIALNKNTVQIMMSLVNGFTPLKFCPQMIPRAKHTALIHLQRNFLYSGESISPTIPIMALLYTTTPVWNYLRKNWLLNEKLAVVYHKRRPICDVTTLHVAAYMGNSTACFQLLKQQAALNPRTNSCSSITGSERLTPMQLVITQLQSVLDLLDKTLTPQPCAVEMFFGYLKTLTVLLTFGAEMPFVPPWLKLSEFGKEYGESVEAFKKNIPRISGISEDLMSALFNVMRLVLLHESDPGVLPLLMKCPSASGYQACAGNFVGHTLRHVLTCLSEENYDRPLTSLEKSILEDLRKKQSTEEIAKEFEPLSNASFVLTVDDVQNLVDEFDAEAKVALQGTVYVPQAKQAIAIGLHTVATLSRWKMYDPQKNVKATIQRLEDKLIEAEEAAREQKESDAQTAAIQRKNVGGFVYMATEDGIDWSNVLNNQVYIVLNKYNWLCVYLQRIKEISLPRDVVLNIVSFVRPTFGLKQSGRLAPDENILRIFATETPSCSIRTDVLQWFISSTVQTKKTPTADTTYNKFTKVNICLLFGGYQGLRRQADTSVMQKRTKFEDALRAANVKVPTFFEDFLNSLSYEDMFCLSDCQRVSKYNTWLKTRLKRKRA
jgi:hypothetical protein